MMGTPRSLICLSLFLSTFIFPSLPICSGIHGQEKVNLFRFPSLSFNSCVFYPLVRTFGDTFLSYLMEKRMERGEEDNERREWEVCVPVSIFLYYPVSFLITDGKTSGM